MPASNPSGHRFWYGLSAILLAVWLSDRYVLLGQFSFLAGLVFAITGWEFGHKNARTKAAGNLVAVRKAISKKQPASCTAAVMVDHDIDKMLALIRNHAEDEKK